VPREEPNLERDQQTLGFRASSACENARQPFLKAWDAVCVRATRTAGWHAVLSECA